jgi:hypothetical protein
LVDSHTAEDDNAFFAASLGATRKLSVSTTPSQLPDADGPLPPGRYLVHVVDYQPPGKTRVWWRVGKFEKGDTLPIAAGVPYFPFRVDGIGAMEINVREGFDDRIAAVTDTGTATLFITRISRDI